MHHKGLNIFSIWKEIDKLFWLKMEMENRRHITKLKGFSRQPSNVRSHEP